MPSFFFERRLVLKDCAEERGVIPMRDDLVSLAQAVEEITPDRAMERAAIERVITAFSPDTFSDKDRARLAFVEAMKVMSLLPEQADLVRAVREDMQTLMALLERKIFRSMWGEELSYETMSDIFADTITIMNFPRTNELHALTVALHRGAGVQKSQMMRERARARQEDLAQKEMHPELQPKITLLETYLSQTKDFHPDVKGLYDIVVSRAKELADVVTQWRLRQLTTKHPWLVHGAYGVAAE